MSTVLCSPHDQPARASQSSRGQTLAACLQQSGRREEQRACGAGQRVVQGGMAAEVHRQPLTHTHTHKFLRRTCFICLMDSIAATPAPDKSASWSIVDVLTWRRGTHFSSQACLQHSAHALSMVAEEGSSSTPCVNLFTHDNRASSVAPKKRDTCTSACCPAACIADVAAFLLCSVVAVVVAAVGDSVAPAPAPAPAPPPDTAVYIVCLYVASPSQVDSPQVGVCFAVRWFCCANAFSACKANRACSSKSQHKARVPCSKT